MKIAAGLGGDAHRAGELIVPRADHLEVQGANVADRVEGAQCRRNIYDPAAGNLLLGPAGTLPTMGTIPNVRGDNVRPPAPRDLWRLLARPEEMAGVEVQAQRRLAHRVHEPQGGHTVVDSLPHVGLDGQPHAVAPREPRQLTDVRDGLPGGLFVARDTA